VCNGRDQVVHCIFTQKPFTFTFTFLVFTTPNKNLGWEGASGRKHLPQSPFTGQFLRKADIRDWSLLVIWSMHATQQDCLPSFLGDGDKRIEIVYDEEKNILYWAD
jgi:hypothetical protein